MSFQTYKTFFLLKNVFVSGVQCPVLFGPHLLLLCENILQEKCQQVSFGMFGFLWSSEEFVEFFVCFLPSCKWNKPSSLPLWVFHWANQMCHSFLVFFFFFWYSDYCSILLVSNIGWSWLNPGWIGWYTGVYNDRTHTNWLRPTLHTSLFFSVMFLMFSNGMSIKCINSINKIIRDPVNWTICGPELFTLQLR